MSQQMPQEFMPWNPEETPSPAPVRRKLKPGVKAAFICLGVLFLAAVVLFGGLFRIRNIVVVSNTIMSDARKQEVIAAGGLEEGMSYFSVSEKRVRETMEQNRYLVCSKVEKFLPGTVTLYVHERMARANVHVLGVTYLLDENGMVLERLPASMNDSLPVVTGLQVRDVTVGKCVVAGSEEQLNAYHLLVQELIDQDWLHGVSELKVSDPDSLYMMTRKGYTVHLGNTEDLRAKIGTVRAVEAKLVQMRYENGVIEASIPAVATFTPSEL